MVEAPESRQVKASGINSIFFTPSGMKYGAWMTAGRATGLFAGDTLKNGIYAIESILRDFLGVPGSAINTASFDAIAKSGTGTRNTWELAVCIYSERNAMDIIHQICTEFRVMLKIAGDGRYTLINLDTASSVYTITSADIAFDVAPMISVSVTSPDEIINSIVADYDTSYPDNSAALECVIADTNNDGALENNLSADSGSPWGGSYSTFLAASKTRYTQRREWRNRFEYIRDASVAELSVKKMADIKAFQRLIVSMTLVKNANTLKLEIGDTVKITSTILTNARSNVTPFMVTKITYPPVGFTSEGTITVECEEMPNTLVGLGYTETKNIATGHLLNA
jgi:hypothetical protein